MDGKEKSTSFMIMVQEVVADLTIDSLVALVITVNSH
jgi:hypothetical protein